MFARRGYNVQSLAVGPSEVEGESRICIVVPGTTTGTGFSNLVKQLLKLVSVQSVTDLTSTPFVNRELMLVKVRLSETGLSMRAGFFSSHQGLTVGTVLCVHLIRCVGDTRTCC